MYEIKVTSENDTINVAYMLGKHLFPGSIITLEGELGVGKTTFTKGIAQALNIKQVINSPTFTIIKEYDGNLPLYHMDAYRIDDDNEDLGFEEYFYGNGICVIEWPQRIRSQIPQERLEINFYLIDNDIRLLVFKPYGKQYEKICEDLQYEKIID
ncbi:MAG TPA: tRNA (adenosine(37)-N6)-threonylcarbamoyltransferase complex ATPase subunit type 1 TsaE [Haloplasmataceae bacterium]